ncbi:hypothetical protein AALO_G00208110 [Alosa alosa]|uniref:SH2 domain-containing protein n=1 Tax=Alosa alosa TaxID=278164 RepID=A0AAV6FZ33_9TELE|nr:hypothetical protein AALO_G00208110 [Alosa alosa]
MSKEECAPLTSSAPVCVHPFRVFHFCHTTVHNDLTSSNALFYFYTWPMQTSQGVEEMFFKNLDDLVKHYKKRNQGLATHLRHAVKRKEMLPNPRVPDEAPDYENVDDTSEYVEVLPS